MTTRDEIRCDGLGCTATTTPRDAQSGWMAVQTQELTPDTVYSRRADLCPVHVQAFLDVCGPLPRTP